MTTRTLSALAVLFVIGLAGARPGLVAAQTAGRAEGASTGTAASAATAAPASGAPAPSAPAPAPASAHAPAPAPASAPAGTAAPRPALSVTITRAERAQWPIRMSANGSIAAWQEAVIGAEIGGLRLSDVRAAVGDVVRRGQVLAELSSETIEAELAQVRAALAEADATLADARANAERAQQVAGTGALSAQQIAQYQTAEKTAQARVQSVRAQLAAVQLRLKFTRVVASDDGVISSRTATLGAVVSPGQELFRLIRRNRLEWRAEVTSSELARIKPGTPVLVTAEGAGAAAGTVRVLGPTVDPQSRNALVYVDLPDAARRGLRPGMFARGAFGLGEQAALSLPQEAVALRDGFAYVFRVAEPAAEQTRVSRAKVQLGRRADNRVEILSGLNAEDTVVSAGAAFLADGDVVRVVRR